MVVVAVVFFSLDNLGLVSLKEDMILLDPQLLYHVFFMCFQVRRVRKKLTVFENLSPLLPSHGPFLHLTPSFSVC